MDFVSHSLIQNLRAHKLSRVAHTRCITVICLATVLLAASHATPSYSDNLDDLAAQTAASLSVRKNARQQLANRAISFPTIPADLEHDTTERLAQLTVGFPDDNWLNKTHRSLNNVTSRVLKRPVFQYDETTKHERMFVSVHQSPEDWQAATAARLDRFGDHPRVVLTSANYPITNFELLESAEVQYSQAGEFRRATPRADTFYLVGGFANACLQHSGYCLAKRWLDAGSSNGNTTLRFIAPLSYAQEVFGPRTIMTPQHLYQVGAYYQNLLSWRLTDALPVPSQPGEQARFKLTAKDGRALHLVLQDDF